MSCGLFECAPGKKNKIEILDAIKESYMEFLAIIARSYKKILYILYGTIHGSWIWFPKKVDPRPQKFQYIFLLALMGSEYYLVHFLMKVINSSKS